MLNPSLSTDSDYTNNIIYDTKIIESVGFCQGDESYQSLGKSLVQNNICPASYAPKCDPCAGTTSVSSSWEWFGLFVLWFIALTVLFWLVYYSLKPPFVLQSDGNQVDTAKVLLSAVISAFVLIVIIWLIKAAMDK